jgi:hypothetical protein
MGVYQKSNNQYIVAPQDCDALKIIMRSIFLQHATNQSQHIAKQIFELNKLVLDYSIYHVYTEAQSYIKFLHDVTTLAVPLSNPIIESQKDKNNYLMPKWF